MAAVMVECFSTVINHRIGNTTIVDHVLGVYYSWSW